MRVISIVTALFLVTACATQPTDHRVTAEIVRPIVIDWGIHSDNPGHLTHQHAGIPGNLATIRSAAGNDVAAVILGDTFDPDQSVKVTILGMLEQASPTGLVSTIIATTGDEISLAELESTRSGSLAVLEAGLVKLETNQSRSLGYQSAERARQFIDSP